MFYVNMRDIMYIYGYFYVYKKKYTIFCEFMHCMYTCKQP